MDQSAQNQYERTMAQLELESDRDYDREEREFEVKALASRRRWNISHTIFLLLLCLSIASIITLRHGHKNLEEGVEKTTMVEVGTDFSEIVGIRRLANITFKDVDGEPKDPIQIFKDHGYTWGRMRVMVDPDGGDGGLIQDVAYAVETAKLLKKFGMKILLAFHYSHRWSNSNNQLVPTTWMGEELEDGETKFARLRAHVHRHTLEVMVELKKAQALPDAVQIGNEVNVGMLWEQGRLPDHIDHFVAFTQAATKGIKRGLLSALAPSLEEGGEQHQGMGKRSEEPKMPLIVLHIAAGNGREFTEQWFQNFTSAGGEFDVIGLSYLPTLHGSMDDFHENIENIKLKFPDKLVWIVETAYNWKESGALSDEQASQLPYPQTPDGQYNFLSQIRSIAEEVGDCAVFYWGSHYTQSTLWLSNSTQQNWEDVEGRALFDEDGTALKGIDGFFAT